MNLQWQKMHLFLEPAINRAELLIIEFDGCGEIQGVAPGDIDPAGIATVIGGTCRTPLLALGLIIPAALIPDLFPSFRKTR